MLFTVPLASPSNTCKTTLSGHIKVVCQMVTWVLNLRTVRTREGAHTLILLVLFLSCLCHGKAAVYKHSKPGSSLSCHFKGILRFGRAVKHVCEIALKLAKCNQKGTDVWLLNAPSARCF